MKTSPKKSGTGSSSANTHEGAPWLYFPYTPRPHQHDIVATIFEGFSDRKTVIMEAATGAGKTICALAPALAYAKKHGKKILYAVRTNSQGKQAILELRTIREAVQKKRPDEQILGVALQGRRSMCPLAQEDENFRNSSADELSKMCSQKKKIYFNSHDPAEALAKRACPYFCGIQETTVETLLNAVNERLPTAEEFIAYCEGRSICPYEANKLIIEAADVIVAPYPYVFEDHIRIKLLDWMHTTLENMLVIVDEAHNLPDYARDLQSVEVSKTTITRALDEAREYECMLAGDIAATQLCSTVAGALRALIDEYTQKNSDALIPPHELETALISELHITTNRLTRLIDELIEHGKAIRQIKLEKNVVPRSYLFALGAFLHAWTTVESDTYVRLANNEDRANPCLEVYCLDAAEAVSFLQSAHSAVCMSGTLAPLDDFQHILGLHHETTCASFPSAFPKENRKVIYSPDVTTAYAELKRSPGMIDDIIGSVTAVCNATDKNTAVFFPSFDLMHTITDPIIREKKLHKPEYTEDRGMGQGTLISLLHEFASHGAKNGAVLFSVIGGRLSEGIDFPAEALEAVVIVGIPYPRPTARQKALEFYYDRHFKKGWEYAVNNPTVRKLLQTMGRLIRSEYDRGIVVLLDKRAQRFTTHIEGLTPSADVSADVMAFFDQCNGKNS